MPNKMDVSREEAVKIKAYRKAVQDKNTDRGLYAVQLRAKENGIKTSPKCLKLIHDW